LVISALTYLACGDPSRPASPELQRAGLGEDEAGARREGKVFCQEAQDSSDLEFIIYYGMIRLMAKESKFHNIQHPQNLPKTEKETPDVFSFGQSGPSPHVPATTPNPPPAEETAHAKSSNSAEPRKPLFSPAIYMSKLADIVSPLFEKLENIPPKKLLLPAGGFLLIALFVIFAAAQRNTQNGGQKPTPSPEFTPTPTEKMPTPQVTPLPDQPLSAKGKIAFLRDGEVWLISPDGTNKVHLIQTSADEETSGTARFFLPQEISDFSWAPDGTKLALTCGGDIWVVDLDNHSRQRLTNREGNESYQEPYWSPNGKLLATVHQVVTGIKDKKDITEQTVSILSLTQVSSSQKHLLYEISITNHFGEEKDSLNSFQFADWFPNSEEILIYRAGEDTTRGLWWLSFDKAIKERLVDLGSAQSIETDIMTDGQNVIYIDNGDVWSVDIISRNKKTITTAKGAVTSYYSPLIDNQNRLLKLNTTLSGTNQLYLAFYNLETQVTDLFWTGLTGTMESYSWSPDNYRAVFTTGQKTLWILDVNTHEQNQVITEAEGGMWNPL